MAEFDFKKITAHAFDYVGANFPIWWAKNETKFDLPDLLNLTAELLNGGKYFTQLKLRYDGEDFLLPNEPLVAISQEKTIVETKPVGGDGEVLEMVSFNNHQITIQGIAINENENRNQYPSEQVSMLERLWTIKEPLEVVGNKYFELYGVREIVIKKRQMDAMPGKQGLQRYQFNAVRHIEFLAELNERNKLLA